MENEVMLKQNGLPAREIGVVTAEIKELCRQANNMALMYAIEIGRRLVEAKSVLQHGQWGEWLKNEVDFSQSTANNFMKLFEEYGSAQITIFGAVANSQSIGNLAYSKALQLLSLPADERESFAEEVRADELSVKELKKAIDEKLAAEKAASEERARADELAEKAALAESAQAEAETLAAEAVELQKKVEELESALQKNRKSLDKAREDLKRAKSDPDIPPEVLKKLQAEAEGSAKQAAEQELRSQLDTAISERDKAASALSDAQKAAADAAARLEEAEKRLKTANPEVTAFKALFEEMQRIAKTLKNGIDKINNFMM